MAKLTDEQRRALQLLARCPDGCTTSIMMAHGFKPEILADLVRHGLAVSKPKTVLAGETPVEVVWMHITEAGRKAIAE
jgi:uncharacterized metal-binding protein